MATNPDDPDPTLIQPGESPPAPPRPDQRPHEKEPPDTPDELEPGDRPNPDHPSITPG